MKLNILSDLHVGFSAHETPLNDADLVVLAGDIAPPRQAAHWAMRLTKPVVRSAALFERNAKWLDRSLDTPHAGPTVVVTHHAPSRQSIHPRFAGSLLNACFVSDAERLVGADRVQCWIPWTHARFRLAGMHLGIGASNCKGLNRQETRHGHA